MPDSSPCRTKKKLTIVVSVTVIETTERDLLISQMGFESTIKLADYQLLSHATFTNFCSRIPIQLDSLKRICEALRLNWEDISQITQKIYFKQIEEKYFLINKKAD